MEQAEFDHGFGKEQQGFPVARFQIDEGERQIIMAQEPGEYVQGLGLLFWLTVRLPARLMIFDHLVIHRQRLFGGLGPI